MVQQLKRYQKIKPLLPLPPAEGCWCCCVSGVHAGIRQVSDFHTSHTFSSN